MNRNNLIVVGVDGSEGGRRALEWAVQEADTRQAAVQVVMGWRWDDIATAMLGPAANQAAARSLLEREIAAVPEAERRQVPISAEVIVGRPADVLIRMARHADLLVLGSHGHSRLSQRVLGSVSQECARYAGCPVVVVPVPQPVAPLAEPALRR